jgi:preprotein translocase subunit SecB
MKAPLELKEYFFPVAQVVADPNVPDDIDVNAISYTIGTSIQKSKGDDAYQVAVDISSPPEDEKSSQAYRIHVVVVGVFKVAQSWEDKEKLLRVNGSSILYSAAREFLITITSRGPYGAVTLPTVSFNTEPAKKMGNEPKALDSGKPKKKKGK